MLNYLLSVHGAFVCVSGVLGIIYPRIYILAFSDEADIFAMHLITRMYSSCILGQAGILYAAMKSTEVNVRRLICKAYAVLFTCTSLCIFLSILSADGVGK